MTLNGQTRNTSSSADQSRCQVFVVQPTLDSRLVLLPEVKVRVRQAGSSLQPALKCSFIIAMNNTIIH